MYLILFLAAAASITWMRITFEGRGMNRITQSLFQSRTGRTLIIIRGGKAFVEYTLSEFTPDELDELALACHAAKEELLASTKIDWTDAVKVVAE